MCGVSHDVITVVSGTKHNADDMPRYPEGYGTDLPSLENEVEKFVEQNSYYVEYLPGMPQQCDIMFLHVNMFTCRRFS